jgi:hypothetical protein
LNRHNNGPLVLNNLRFYIFVIIVLKKQAGRNKMSETNLDRMKNAFVELCGQKAFTRFKQRMGDAFSEATLGYELSERRQDARAELNRYSIQLNHL